VHIHGDWTPGVERRDFGFEMHFASGVTGLAVWSLGYWWISLSALSVAIVSDDIADLLVSLSVRAGARCAEAEKQLN
jgi:hypothetical protein